MRPRHGALPMWKPDFGTRYRHLPTWEKDTGSTVAVLEPGHKKVTIRCHIIWRVISVCIGILWPFYGFPGKNGLSSKLTLHCLRILIAIIEKLLINYSKLSTHLFNIFKGCKGCNRLEKPQTVIITKKNSLLFRGGLSRWMDDMRLYVLTMEVDNKRFTMCHWTPFTGLERIPSPVGVDPGTPRSASHWLLWPEQSPNNIIMCTGCSE